MGKTGYPATPFVRPLPVSPAFLPALATRSPSIDFVGPAVPGAETTVACIDSRAQFRVLGAVCLTNARLFWCGLKEGLLTQLLLVVRVICRVPVIKLHWICFLLICLISQRFPVSN